MTSEVVVSYILRWTRPLFYTDGNTLLYLPCLYYLPRQAIDKHWAIPAVGVMT